MSPKEGRKQVVLGKNDVSKHRRWEWGWKVIAPCTPPRGQMRDEQSDCGGSPTRPEGSYDNLVIPSLNPESCFDRIPAH